MKELLIELDQTEQSARRHCEREARRLEGTPPADAMRAISRHAALVNGEIAGLGDEKSEPRLHWGKVVGELFTTVRHYALDRMIDSQRSYRGTLIGVHHGIDLVRMISLCARRSGDEKIESFCGRWLAEREPLMTAATNAMHWFAEHPDRARQRATAVQS